MAMMDKLSTVPKGWLQWRPLLGLAALQAAITLTWVVYNAYLVQLLGRFGFPAAWATVLLVIESGIAMVLEPLMGWLSDRALQRALQRAAPATSTLSPARWVASRFPFIAIGTILAAGCFGLIPLIATGTNPQPVMAWILPALIIIWSMCMSIFQSPAMALLGQYASPGRGPQATSILLIAMVLVRSFGAASNQLILSWGPVAAFTIGSIGLLVAAFLLYCLQPPVGAPLNAPPPELPSQPRRLTGLNLGLIFVVGSGVGLTGRCIGTILAGKLWLPGVSLALVWSLTQAVVLGPVGGWANHLATRRTLLSSLSLVALLLLTIGRQGDQMAVLLGLTVMLGLAYSFVGVTTFPFVLDRVPRHWAGLGMGAYFSGAALAGTVFGTALPGLGTPSFEPMALMGVAGVGVEIAGTIASRRR